MGRRGPCDVRMTDSDAPYEFEISLVDGQRVAAEIDADDLDGLRDHNPGYMVDPNMEPREAAATLLYSMLLYRVDTREGEVGVRDRDGRNWIIPASSIVAFSYRAPADIGRRSLGFVKPRG